jgi:hypothetical protein
MEGLRRLPQVRGWWCVPYHRVKAIEWHTDIDMVSTMACPRCPPTHTHSAEGMNQLKEAAGPTLVPLVMDVTKPEQVQAVLRRIEEEAPEGLFALVNNAGGCACVCGVSRWRRGSFALGTGLDACLRSGDMGSQLIDCVSLAGIGKTMVVDWASMDDVSGCSLSWVMPCSSQDHYQGSELLFFLRVDLCLCSSARRWR